MNRRALRLLAEHPAQVARWCGLSLIRDDIHNDWMRLMITGREDMTLLAHRGSYKTTCLAMSMVIMMLVYPSKNILFLRKTDDDVVEVIRQVKQLIVCPAIHTLSEKLYGTAVRLRKSDMFCVVTDCYCPVRGAPQLLGQGTRSSLTGKHADIIITDDIVNLQDRISPVERERIKGVYQELQNIRNPGGRIINTGTPWHPQDAISLMPNILRYDCYTTGLLTQEELQRLRQAMAPSLFAANYELQHIAQEDALLSQPPRYISDASLLRDGIAHVDAAYGGQDYTALTCARRRGDEVVLLGKLWRKPVDDVMPEILSICNEHLCAPIFVETNGDKGYLARELRREGALVRPYHEQMPKATKIAAYLRKWWPHVTLLEGTDPDYTAQLMDYTPFAAHDDAPDSAACALRLLDKT